MTKFVEPEMLANICVVLVRPRVPENIGSAARAIANMGLGQLRLVMPENFRIRSIHALATACGRPVLEGLDIFPTLSDALSDCTSVVVTTARQGTKRGRLVAPRQAAPRMLQWAAQGRTALVFGPEDRGLTTAEIDTGRLSLTIPTSTGSSLNLAQAIMVVAYELRMAALEQRALRPVEAKAAPNMELEGLKEHLKEALVAIGTLPAENTDHFFRPFKQSLENARLTSRQIRALRGIARQVLWMVGQLKEKNSATE